MKEGSKKPSAAEMRGQIKHSGKHGAMHVNSLFMSVYAGKANCEGVDLKLSTAQYGGMIVQNPENGKAFVIGFKDAINLAVEAGLLNDEYELIPKEEKQNAG
jgi:hypothetical protein